MTNTTRKVIIIGSGPAGFTAAIYCARANLQPLIFEGSAPNISGGQLMTTSDVENYPGFPSGIMGPELMNKFRDQAIRFGAEVKSQNIIKVGFDKAPFKVVNEDNETFQALSIIIATGANAQLLGVDKEKELIASGSGVSACATCDGAFYKDVDVAVVGGGDTAMEEALFLTRFAKTVTIIHRREGFRASQIMLERAKNHPKIKWQLNKVVKQFITAPKPPLNRENLISVLLQDTKDGSESKIDVEGLFVAIGHKPNTELFSDYLALDQKKYLITIDNSTKTNIDGIFACGDVQDSYYRQAITAAGTGCMAAIDAERFLENQGS